MGKQNNAEGRHPADNGGPGKQVEQKQDETPFPKINEFPKKWQHINSESHTKYREEQYPLENDGRGMADAKKRDFPPTRHGDLSFFVNLVEMGGIEPPSETSYLQNELRAFSPIFSRYSRENSSTGGSPNVLLPFLKIKR